MISQGAVTYAAWKVKTPLEVSSVMSGLRGLRLWKFEITTDAPDTQFTRNTKSRAQKSHRAMVAFRAAHTTNVWSE